MNNSVIVRAYGRQLDELRGAASRIARERRVDWSVEAANKGTRFSFEDATSVAAFMSFCEDLGISYYVDA
jgi:hypothetical protein